MITTLIARVPASAWQLPLSIAPVPSNGYVLNCGAPKAAGMTVDAITVDAMAAGAGAAVFGTTAVETHVRNARDSKQAAPPRGRYR